MAFPGRRSGQNIAAVRMTVTAVQGHATKHAVANTVLPADQINVQVSPTCCQASVQSARWYHLVSPSPSSPAASTPQNLTSGRRLSRLAPKFLILEVIGLGRAEPIFIAASRSQDVIRSARRDPTRVCFPCGWRGSRLTLRAGSGRFQDSSVGHFSLCHVAPERDQQFAGQRNNCYLN